MPKYIPYRGDGFSKDFKERKKFVNLRQLRWSLAKTTLGILVILSIITFGFLQIPANPQGEEDQTHIVALVFIWIFAFILLAGIWHLNKFRKGYDVDTSETPSKNEDNSQDE